MQLISGQRLKSVQPKVKILRKAGAGFQSEEGGQHFDLQAQLLTGVEDLL